MASASHVSSEPPQKSHGQPEKRRKLSDVLTFDKRGVYGQMVEKNGMFGVPDFPPATDFGWSLPFHDARGVYHKCNVCCPILPPASDFVQNLPITTLNKDKPRMLPPSCVAYFLPPVADFDQNFPLATPTDKPKMLETALDVPENPNYPSRFHSGRPLNLKKRPETLKTVTDLSHSAIQHYNDNHGTNYGIVNVVKATFVGVAGFIYYITFEAKDKNRDDGQLKTFQAKVWQRILSIVEVISCDLKRVASASHVSSEPPQKSHGQPEKRRKFSDVLTFDKRGVYGQMVEKNGMFAVPDFPPATDFGWSLPFHDARGVYQKRNVCCPILPPASDFVQNLPITTLKDKPRMLPPSCVAFVLPPVADFDQNFPLATPTDKPKMLETALDVPENPKYPSRFHFGRPLNFKKRPETLKTVTGLSHSAIQHYNDNHGTNYGVVSVVKVSFVGVAGFIYYITFEAKDKNRDDGQLKTFQAKVWQRILSIVEVISCDLKRT